MYVYMGSYYSKFSKETSAQMILQEAKSIHALNYYNKMFTMIYMYNCPLPRLMDFFFIMK